jgi:hypothetical protein
LVFHVLKWTPGGSITGPNTPAAGALRSVTYATNATNTRSSPFVDYDGDAAYVGSDNGYLYKITGVFKGTLAVGPPVLVTSNAKLTGAVRDPFTGLVFVSDGQYVKAYDSNLAHKAELSVSSSSTGIVDPPIVDVTNKFVYVISRYNSAGTQAAAVQIPYSASSPWFGTPVYGDIGRTGGNYLRSGAFDNGYYTAPSSGALYVCGNQGSGSSPDGPALYKFTFRLITGKMNVDPVVKNTKIGSATEECSPLTEFSNGNDRLFLSHSGVHQVQMWQLPVASADDDKDASYGVPNGTCGIIVDNISPEAQASSIYFSTRGAYTEKCMVSGYPRVCAVKLTQAGLL